MIRLLAQIGAYAAFVLVVGLLSVWPDYRLLSERQAMLSLTFSHAAERVQECRRLTQEELNELPPNMRKPDDCPRERHPVLVEMHVDGTPVYTVTAPPSGLWKDGKSNVYHRLAIDAGDHEIFIGMNDAGTAGSYTYEARQDVTIEAGRNLVVGFDGPSRTFVIE